MCGIAGLWQQRGAPREALRSCVQAMAATLRHRGPDDGDTWVDEAAGVALGFRRLSILDLSPTGRQPMRSADGRFVVVFNGEIYNHRDLRAELERRGHQFRGSSDTEVMLAGAMEWGADAVIARLWGMFAIAIWDSRERELIVARDRIGKKPLYYWGDHGTFLFASELKALRAHPAFPAEIDRDALTAYLRFGYVPAPSCIYSNTHKLPPGCVALLRAGRTPEVRPYWEAQQIARDGLLRRMDLSDREAADQLDTLLRDAVARRMIADVPIGAMLSGGFDSSTIVALMQAQSARPVRTFTIGFHEAAYNEADAAKRVAGHLGTDHTELYVTPKEALEVIPRLPSLYDEPFADSSQIPTFLVFKLARQHVTVALSGDGGDELFGGYTRYHWADTIWRRVRRVPHGVRSGLARVLKARSPEAWNSLYDAVKWTLPKPLRQSLPGEKAHKLAELLTVDQPDALYQRLVSLWKAPGELAVAGQEPASMLVDPAVREAVSGFSERMMLLDLMTYLPDDILVKVDRASMGVSLEVRCPLLDHRVVEWSWRLPLRFKYRKGKSKWLLREVLRRYVPMSLVERPKMGFGVPIDAWLRGPLREWADGLLDAGQLAREGLLRPGPIHEAWAAHLSGRRNEQYRLWVVLMFQAWLRSWPT